MAVKLLHLCLLLVLLCPGQAKKQPCLRSASSCDECIQSSPECAWCTAPDANIRCHTLRGLQRAGCHKSHTYHPQGNVQVVKNESSTESANASVAFLQPQEFSLRLRPGVSQSFPLTITTPTDQPITELTLDASPLPAGVNITFSSSVNGNHLVVQVNVDAAHCPSESDVSSGMQNRTGPWSVHITPRGFSLSVKLEISLECECECTRNREENSLSCSGRGALACGQCECDEPSAGKRCQRDADSVSSASEDACRSGPNAPVCSGRGTCMDGFCECEKRPNPAERYSGKFCECSNFDCPYHKNRICGGHGMCECGNCVCDNDWTGDDCSCTMETTSCLGDNQMLCSGRGTCECGRCKCVSPYAGPTCETSAFQPSPCVENWECVECRAFGTGTKKDRCQQECGSLTITKVATRHDLVQQGENTVFCKMMNREEHCLIYFSLDSTSSDVRATVVQFRDCPGFP